jgi:hypothetical protein
MNNVTFQLKPFLLEFAKPVSLEICIETDLGFTARMRQIQNRIYAVIIQAFSFL